MMFIQAILVIFVGCLSLPYGSAVPDTGCVAMDKCITDFENALGGVSAKFEYTAAKCGAIDAAIRCIKGLIDAADKCQGLKDPQTTTLTYTKVLEQLAKYCEPGAAVTDPVTAPKSTCGDFKTCFAKILPPAASKSYMLPAYWCGVAKATIGCDVPEANHGDAICLETGDATIINGLCETVDVTKAYVPPPPVVTGCGPIDACIEPLKNALAGADGATAVFGYTTPKCKAVTTALTCFKDANIANCEGYTDPLTDLTYDYAKLVTELGTYCKADNTGIAFSNCATLTTCVNKINLPADDKYYALPDYWCGVLTAAINCDIADAPAAGVAETGDCATAPAKKTTWCPNVQNVAENPYDPTNDKTTTAKPTTSTTSAPTCAAMDACVTALKVALGETGKLEYTDAKCKAVTDALACFKKADTAACTGYSKPDTSAYTYDDLVTEFATYCTAEGTAARAKCVPLKSCIDTIKLPTDDMYYTLPNYWCGVLTAAITCDKADVAADTVPDCKAAPEDTKVKTWCDGVADLTTTDYTPPKVTSTAAPAELTTSDASPRVKYSIGVMLFLSLVSQL